MFHMKMFIKLNKNQVKSKKSPILSYFLIMISSISFLVSCSIMHMPTY